MSRLPLATYSRPLLAVIAVVVLGAVVLLREAPTAQAQSTTAATAPTFQWSSYYINQVLPSSTNDSVIKVFPFPERPAFIVQTQNAFTVWVRLDGGLRSLLEIKLATTEKFRDIVFLDDDRTFIIHTNKAARAYSVDQRLMPPTTSK